MATVEQPSDELAKRYVLEDLLNIIYPFQRISGFVFHNFKRVGERLASKDKRRLLNITIAFMILETCGNVISIVLAVREGNVNEISKTLATFSNLLICTVRGLAFTVKHEEIKEIVNELDHLFPRSASLQQRLKVPENYTALMKRFNFMRKYASLGVSLFYLLPLVNFLIYQNPNEPVVSEYHVLGAWRPMKDKYSFYPYNFVYEVILTTACVSHFFTWDTVFVIILHQICMHYEFLAAEVSRMNALDTINEDKEVDFHRRWLECVAFQQHINKLAKKVNDVFNLSILVSDFVCASCICLNFYMVINSNDWLILGIFVVPCTVIGYLAFDISKLGNQLEESSGRIQEALYNQNWYDGSMKYRKLTLLWLQLSQNPMKLTAFELFEVNMVHFKEIMMFSYQLLTFMQSHR